MSASDIHQHIIDTFQTESRIIIAALLNTLCDIELAEDGLQDALVDALQQWSQQGIPKNPKAWIMTTARRKVIDRLRRADTAQKHVPTLHALQEFERQEELSPDHALDEQENIPDERLKLIFTCCHPALAPDTQIALTLQTVVGLATDVIAKTFLLPKATMAQRLVRTKRKIRDAGIPYEIPPVEKLGERLDAVLSVIYFIFNAGYTAPIGDELITVNLCEEAIYLARTLSQLLKDQVGNLERAETLGLLALMLMQHARHHSRLRADGQMLLLDQQDRTKWNREAINEGIELLDQAMLWRKRGAYQIQAAIVALHSMSESIEETDWKQIALLYGALMEFMPSAVVELNRAVAIAMSEGFEAGLALLNDSELQERLKDYYLYHATRADFLRRLARKDEAQASYIKALKLCENQVERRFLEQRLVEFSSSNKT